MFSSQRARRLCFTHGYKIFLRLEKKSIKGHESALMSHFPRPIRQNSPPVRFPGVLLSSTKWHHLELRTPKAEALLPPCTISLGGTSTHPRESTKVAGSSGAQRTRDFLLRTNKQMVSLDLSQISCIYAWYTVRVLHQHKGPENEDLRIWASIRQ